MILLEEIPLGPNPSTDETAEKKGKLPRQNSSVIICLHVCVFIHVGRPEVNLGCLPQSSSTFYFRQGLILSLDFADLGLGWTVSEPQGPTWLPLGWKAEATQHLQQTFYQAEGSLSPQWAFRRQSHEERAFKNEGACQGMDMDQGTATISGQGIAAFAFWLLELLGTADRLDSPPFCRVACAMSFLLTPYTGLKGMWPYDIS